MIESPPGILALLLLIEAGVLLAAERQLLPRPLRLLPPLFWIYFLPTVASAISLIPSRSPVYGATIAHLLPASLVLLFLSVDVPAILRLGPLALGTMAASTAGIFLGAPVVLWLLGRWLPADAWSGLGALSASWMGGSANMVAVKASIDTPDAVFAQMVVVDVVAAYAWMALLMGLVRCQGQFDRWNRSRTGLLARLSRGAMPAAGDPDTQAFPLRHLVSLALVGAGGAVLARGAALLLPELPGVVSFFTWTVLVASAVGISLSFTAARRLEAQGASRLGHALLYLVLTCIGAQADLAALTQAPLFVLAGVLWLALHGLLLLLAGRLLRAPLFLLATASQANVGGPVSAPVVAAAYQPGLAGVGLLLAVLGNVGGTYLGILCSLLCRAVATA